MTNKQPTKAEIAAQEAEAEARNAAADEADVAARALNYNSSAELDPAGEASKQRDPLPVQWYHDASHSADAERLAQQRARDEAAGISVPKKDD